MKKDVAERTAAFFIANGIKAQDLYFGWGDIFDEMAKIELSRKGLVEE